MRTLLARLLAVATLGFLVVSCSWIPSPSHQHCPDREPELATALRSRDVETVARLLDSGADPNRQYRPCSILMHAPYTNYLHIAVRTGSYEAIARLLKAGARPDVVPRGSEPLLFAFSPNNSFRTIDEKLDAMQLVIRGGARIDVAAQGGELLIERLVYWGELKEAAFILNMLGPRDTSGLDKALYDILRTDFRGNSQHRRNSREEYAEFAKALISKGADINAKSLYGYSGRPAIFVLMGQRQHPSGHQSMAALLQFYLENGGDPTVTEPDKNWTLAHASATCSECIALITRFAIPLNVKTTSTEYTPAHVAAAGGNLDALRALHRAGADMNALAQCRRSTIHLVVLSSQEYIGNAKRLDVNVAILRQLLGWGVDPNTRDCQEKRATEYIADSEHAAPQIREMRRQLLSAANR